MACVREGCSCFLSGIKTLNDQLQDAGRADGRAGDKKTKRKNKPCPLYFNPNRPCHTKPRLAQALYYHLMCTTGSLSLQLPGQHQLRTTPCGFPLTHRHSCRTAALQPHSARQPPSLRPASPLALLFGGPRELGTQGHHSDSCLWNPEFLHMFLQPGFIHLFQKSKAVNSHSQFITARHLRKQPPSDIVPSTPS